MNEKYDQAFQQATAFQKMWTDAFAQMADVWGRFSPGKPPPDAIREVRAEILKVMTEAWNQFVSTPQFLEYMKASMDGFMDLRKGAADAMTRNHHEMQFPAREDIDAVLLAIRHMERRLLDRIEDIENGVNTVGRRLDEIERSPQEPVKSAASKPTAAAKPAVAPKTSRRKAPRRRAK